MTIITQRSYLWWPVLFRAHQIETRQYSAVSLWLWDICHIRGLWTRWEKFTKVHVVLCKGFVKTKHHYIIHEQGVLGFFGGKGKVSSKSECNQTDNNHNSHVESLTICLWNSVTRWVYCMQNATKRTNWVWHIFRDCARAVAQFWERESGQNETCPFI